MPQSRLFDMDVPLESKYDAKQAVFDPSNHKKIFEILTPQKCYQSSTSRSFHDLLSQFDIGLIQGNIMHFFVWQNIKVSWIALFYARVLVQTPIWIRTPLFFLSFFLKLVWNFFILIVTSLIRYPYANRTHSSPVESRAMMLEVMKRAEQEGWSILNINTDLESDNVTSAFISHLFPALTFTVWNRSVTAIASEHVVTLTPDSLYSQHPIFWEIRRFIEENPHDIIFIASRDGEQEYAFLSELVRDNAVEFKVGSVYYVADISQRASQKHMRANLKTNLAFIAAATRNQFVNALDHQEKYDRWVELTIHNSDGQVLYDEAHQKPSAAIPRGQGLQHAIDLLLHTLNIRPTSIETVGWNQELSPQIVSSWAVLRKRGYSIARDQYERVELRYTGDGSDFPTQKWHFLAKT
jgi:hypothetical protein